MPKWRHRKLQILSGKKPIKKKANQLEQEADSKANKLVEEAKAKKEELLNKIEK